MGRLEIDDDVLAENSNSWCDLFVNMLKKLAAELKKACNL
jgi:hypothetical protein